jgi:hypothetical protein
MEEFGATRGAIVERIDRLQDSFADIRNDIAVNYDSTNAAIKVNENSR